MLSSAVQTDGTFRASFDTSTLAEAWDRRDSLRRCVWRYVIRTIAQTPARETDESHEPMKRMVNQIILRDHKSKAICLTVAGRQWSWPLWGTCIGGGLSELSNYSAQRCDSMTAPRSRRREYESLERDGWLQQGQSYATGRWGFGCIKQVPG